MFYIQLILIGRVNVGNGDHLSENENKIKYMNQLFIALFLL